jgi:hypothetical protein
MTNKGIEIRVSRKSYSNPIGFVKWGEIFSRELRPQTPARANAHVQTI